MRRALTHALAALLAFATPSPNVAQDYVGHGPAAQTRAPNDVTGNPLVATRLFNPIPNGRISLASRRTATTFTGSHPATQWFAQSIDVSDYGSGKASCPECASVGMGVSVQKVGDTPGEMDGLYIVGRQRVGDLAGALIDVGAIDGFSALIEGHSNSLGIDGAVLQTVAVQVGAVDNHAHEQYGLLLQSRTLPATAAILIGSTQGGSWTDAFRYMGPTSQLYRLAGSGQVDFGSEVSHKSILSNIAGNYSDILRTDGMPIERIFEGSHAISGSLAVGKLTAPKSILDIVGSVSQTGGPAQFGVGLSTADARLTIGAGRSGNGNSYLDLIGDETYAGYGARIVRTPGANGATVISHRGTGPLMLQSPDGGEVQAVVGGMTMIRASATGVGFNGALIAKPTLPAAATDLTSVIALVNALRSVLIAYGLAQ